MNPYRRLNLTRNPFGELTRLERAELSICSLDPWLALLQGPEASRQVIQFMVNAVVANPHIYSPSNNSFRGLGTFTCPWMHRFPRFRLIVRC